MTNSFNTPNDEENLIDASLQLPFDNINQHAYFPPKNTILSNNINQTSLQTELQILDDLTPISSDLQSTKQSLPTPNGKQSQTTPTTHGGLHPAPLPSPVHPNSPPQSHATSLMLLTIPIRIPPSLQRDTDNNLPLADHRFHHILNLYQAYQGHSTNKMGTTLAWLKLLRGLQNNSSWLPTWSHLLSIDLMETQTYEHTKNTMNLLRSQAILLLLPPRTLNQTQAYNWFPLVPATNFSHNLREIH